VIKVTKPTLRFKKTNGDRAWTWISDSLCESESNGCCLHKKIICICVKEKSQMAKYSVSLYKEHYFRHASCKPCGWFWDVGRPGRPVIRRTFLTRRDDDSCCIYHIRRPRHCPLVFHRRDRVLAASSDIGLFSRTASFHPTPVSAALSPATRAEWP